VLWSGVAFKRDFVGFVLGAESARASNSQDVGPREARLATDVRPSGEEPRRGASPAALGALVNRVNNLLRGQAGSALSVSGVVFQFVLLIWIAVSFSGGVCVSDWIANGIYVGEGHVLLEKGSVGLLFAMGDFGWGDVG
jgi:hypothetical protein